MSQLTAMANIVPRARRFSLMRQLQPDYTGEQPKQQQDAHRADRFFARHHPDYHGAKCTNAHPDSIGRAEGDRLRCLFKQREADARADEERDVPTDVFEPIRIAKAGGKTDLEQTC